MKQVAFALSYPLAVRRLIASVTLLLGAAAAIAWDQLRGRNTRRARAIHVRRMFERMSGAFLVIGRHLGRPFQLVQSAYGEELASLRNHMAPCPIDEAVAVIERTTGKPLQMTFKRLDPAPVVSTSAACTYQAILLTGERVIAKVRRPGAGEALVADLKVIDWWCVALELLTILRPGVTQKIRRELRDTLFDELDFVREARLQDKFRRAARASGKRFFTAPRVRFELSSQELVVQEFVSGMWLWELLAGVEQQDQRVLGLAARLRIDPRQVARRLLWTSFWSWHESMFFLADPHPSTVIVGAGGKLAFIDFQSTGAMDRTKRRALQQNMYYVSKEDPLSMARASITLLEPLPPVDSNALTRDLEAHNWEVLYALATKGVQRPWFERTTTLQWMGLAKVARQYGVVIDTRVLRLLEATIMHETLAVRLDASVDVVKQYVRFKRDRAARAARQVLRAAARRASSPIQKSTFVDLEQIAGTAEGLLFRLTHLLTLPRVNFNAMVGKGSSTVVQAARFGLHTAALLALATAAVAGSRYLSGAEPVSLASSMTSAASSLVFQAAAVVLLIANARALLFRLEDKDL